MANDDFSNNWRNFIEGTVRLNMHVSPWLQNQYEHIAYQLKHALCEAGLIEMLIREGFNYVGYQTIPSDLYPDNISAVKNFGDLFDDIKIPRDVMGHFVGGTPAFMNVIPLHPAEPRWFLPDVIDEITLSQRYNLCDPISTTVEVHKYEMNPKELGFCGRAKRYFEQRSLKKIFERTGKAGTGFIRVGYCVPPVLRGTAPDESFHGILWNWNYRCDILVYHTFVKDGKITTDFEDVLAEAKHRVMLARKACIKWQILTE